MGLAVFARWMEIYEYCMWGRTEQNIPTLTIFKYWAFEKEREVEHSCPASGILGNKAILIHTTKTNTFFKVFFFTSVTTFDI